MTRWPTRRRFIQLGAALPFATPLRAFAQGAAAFDHDVVVVGAGAAGIAAGRELARRGKSFVIIEARQRVGGRVFTDASLGERFDAGAIYIHWAEKNPWRALAQELGVEILDSERLPGSFRLFENGQTIQRTNRRGYAVINERFDPDLSPVPDIAMSARVAADGDDALRAVSNLTRMALGEEAERVSSLDYARLWAGDDYVAPDGYGSLVTRAAQGLPVRLGVTVRGIDWSGQGVTVDTDQGALRARAVIVTVPAARGTHRLHAAPARRHVARSRRIADGGADQDRASVQRRTLRRRARHGLVGHRRTARHVRFRVLAFRPQSGRRGVRRRSCA
jgi:monoamine oxidase